MRGTMKRRTSRKKGATTILSWTVFPLVCCGDSGSSVEMLQGCRAWRHLAQADSTTACLSGVHFCRSVALVHGWRGFLKLWAMKILWKKSRTHG